jgi:hypothetical protein
MGDIMFILIAFIMVVAVIAAAENLMTSMLVVSLLTNFLVLGCQINKISNRDKPTNLLTPYESFGNPGPLGVDNYGAPPADIYGKNSDLAGPSLDQLLAQQEHDKYNLYTEYNKPSYTPYDSLDPRIYTRPLPDGDNAYNVNNSGVNISLNRTRDKRVLDGWATKDVNYYKYHFSNELANEENKPWWGRNEY